MTMKHARFADLFANRHGLLALLALMTAIVTAQDNPRLAVPPTYNSYMTEEIYQQAEGWRETPSDDDSWRIPEPEPRARITFGFDSAFEEQRMRNHSFEDSRFTGFENTTPGTQFRVEFFPEKPR